MSWLGLLLIGMGVTDLVHSARRDRHLPQVAGALAVLVVAIPIAGLIGVGDLVAVFLIATAVLGWGYVVTYGFGEGGRSAAVALACGAGAVVLMLILSPLAGQAEGLLSRWLVALPHDRLAGLDPDWVVVLLGVFLIQLSTGNVVVRLVLSVTDTINPMKDGSLPATALKGGRLLGPMERVLILGLGLAGQFTAASIVIAAKGLLRFPELSSPREQAEVHRMTEYFLVGSFVSWLIALGGLALLG